MMKGMLKRCLGVVAAAAMAVTGMAALTVTANASSDTLATITINNAQPGHTYTAYRFATFSDPERSNTNNSVYVDVNTVTEEGNNWTSVLTAAFSGVTSDGTDEGTPYVLGDVYASNPAAAIATLSPAQLRQFADALSNTSIAAMAPADSYAVTGTDPQDVVLGGDSDDTLLEGWYIVTDTTTVNGETVYHPIAIVATNITPYVEGGGTVTVNPGDGQLNINDLGVVNAKTVTEPAGQPEKDAYDEDDSQIDSVTVEGEVQDTDTGTVNIGDTVNFTVTDTIPSDANAYDSYEFTFFDHASKGLDLDENSFAVYVDANNDNTYETRLDGATATFVMGGDPTDAPDGSDATNTTVTVVIDTLDGQNYAGKNIQLQYSAVVTSDAEGGQTQNTASVSHNGGATSDGDTVTLKYGEFQFQKVNKEDAGLADVVFNVYEGDLLEDNDLSDDTALTFSQEQDEDGAAIGGAYVRDDAGAADILTADDGMLTVRGLKDGTYTVVETSNPDAQYATNYYAKFTVTVTNGVAVVNANDANHLVTPAQGEGVATVLNVRGVAELPSTGAAGITAFIVLGLLIAGAGVTVYMKSRNVRRMMRA
ncbi:isopeptide-forming domain-containing fimbrial protein [Bifidobacterium phasiani]|uniref:Isopeptide-forming domain-containing fimbrial protein n=1 Tax=Bifidobacterium phasiani TaxID=2834431 RepID=A0ABS6WAY6_9BIFI|nr:isopeptide-forming domain-containing fimbrial protein [Bifidobacterium phasiani]MBW3083467.1 isopeptide-forming domain-containing fimbrial protein [Bifidobacterium phasiani]